MGGCSSSTKAAQLAAEDVDHEQAHVFTPQGVEAGTVTLHTPGAALSPFDTGNNGSSIELLHSPWSSQTLPETANINHTIVSTASVVCPSPLGEIKRAMNADASPTLESVDLVETLPDETVAAADAQADCPATSSVQPHPGASELGLPKAGLPEAGLPKAGLPEAGLPEAGLPEAGLPPISVSIIPQTAPIDDTSPCLPLDSARKPLQKPKRRSSAGGLTPRDSFTPREPSSARAYSGATYQGTQGRAETYTHIEASSEQHLTAQPKLDGAQHETSTTRVRKESETSVPQETSNDCKENRPAFRQKPKKRRQAKLMEPSEGSQSTQLKVTRESA